MQISKLNSKRMRGFTLIEMLVVIAVIGILAGIMLVNLGNVRARGRDARRLAELKQVQIALESYYNSSVGNQKYPAVTGTGISRWCALQGVLDDIFPSGFQLPVDPTTRGVCGSGSAPTVSGELYYDFLTSGDQQAYVLRARLEDVTNPELQRSYRGSELDCSAPSVYCLRQP